MKLPLLYYNIKIYCYIDLINYILILCIYKILLVSSLFISPVTTMNIHAEEIVNQDKKSNEKAFTVANSYFQTVINNTESNWNEGKNVIHYYRFNTI